MRPRGLCILPPGPAMHQQRLPTRRDFGKLAPAAATWSAAAGKIQPLEPGIKLCVQVGSDPSEEDLQFVQQLGVRYLTIWVRGPQATLENFLRLRRKVEGAGLKIWNIGNSDVHNMEEVTLNLPGRDRKIEEYKQYVRNLRKAGIYDTTYAHMGNGIWSTEPDNTQGGARARAFDLAKAV